MFGWRVPVIHWTPDDKAVNASGLRRFFAKTFEIRMTQKVIDYLQQSLKLGQIEPRFSITLR
jgi:hypothetical protein